MGPNVYSLAQTRGMQRSTSETQWDNDHLPVDLARKISSENVPFSGTGTAQAHLPVFTSASGLHLPLSHATPPSLLPSASVAPQSIPRPLTHVQVLLSSRLEPSCRRHAWIAHPLAANATSARRPDRLSFHVTHDVRHTSQVKPLFGTVFFWTRTFYCI